MALIASFWNRRQSLIAVIAAAVLGLGACASHPPAPMSAAVDYNYIIGPGDTLNIVVWRNPELTQSVPVRPDGKIAAPLLENIVAMGKDPSTLSRELEKELSRYIRDPVVTVVVTGFVGPYSQQVRVVGEAARPQLLPYTQHMTLLDVIIAVGGITDFADGNGATIYRSNEKKQYSVRIDDLIRDGDVSANVEMRPGDILIIPQSWF